MGSFIARGLKVTKYSKDIPQLTEYLANNETFIKYALKVNNNTNKGLSRFQRFLHESAFPEEVDHSKPSHKSGGHLHDHHHHKK